MSRTAEPTSPASSFKSLFISAIICYRKDLNGDAGRGGALLAHHGFLWFSFLF